ncbi:hypothetical protein [Methylocystis parvus]|nr:hypothetical protein [Methylocystis parvus]WBJ98722.1 hypothetical protein MMG94_11925 [Methylocystis parvus OBBP]
MKTLLLLPLLRLFAFTAILSSVLAVEEAAPSAAAARPARFIAASADLR